MSAIIVKPVRDRDFYVEWSSIVEAPLSWGPASFFAPERVARADTNGSSQIDGAMYGAWGEDRDLIYEQRGWVRIANLEALCAVLAETNGAYNPNADWFIHPEWFIQAIEDDA